MSAKFDLTDNGKCFACGKHNPIGLQLDFVHEGDEYVTYFTPKPEHQGWQGVVHGGLVATVMDEVMAQCLHVRKYHAVTGEISVRYRKPCPIGERVRFAGRIDNEEGRIVYCSARATTEDGTLIAEATSKMVKVH